VLAPEAAPRDIRRSATYARVSTERQETENQGEQFRRLFEDASRREFNVVLFWELDRFTREGPLETLQHLNVLSNYGVAFRSFTEPYTSSRSSDRVQPTTKR
jgi:DNA invertase Pin-like site-specific DNA recombinase